MALLDFDFYSAEICKTVHAQAILPIADAVPAPELPLSPHLRMISNGWAEFGRTC